MEKSLYQRAGIADIAEFYRTKFASDEVLDARYFRALDRFDIRYARTMWVYDNVRPGSTVLDLGCGAGMLALLKRKGLTLVGVDLSPECAQAALRNGYDVTARAELTHLPFGDETFDYVVSLDVLGHVEFSEKDEVLREIKRVLKPGGVTMHGIECINPKLQKRYEQMSAEELTRFVRVDGHVGLEEEEEHAKRFQNVFSNVAWESRFTLCLSSEEFLKQADEYALPFDKDLIDYLRGLSFNQRRAFDIAMGYVFSKISDLALSLPKSGFYVFLKASNAPLGPFYNEHLDRKALFADRRQDLDGTCLDRSVAVFDGGWYEPDLLPPVARWMSDRGSISFRAEEISTIRLDLTSHMRDLRERPLGLEFRLNGERISAFSLFNHGWLELHLTVPDVLSSEGEFTLEISADRTWQPRPNDPENRDDRELSIAVCNIEVTSRS